MSDAQLHADTAEEHDSGIKTPKQLIAVVTASIVVPVLAILLLVEFVDTGAKPSAGVNGLGAEAVAQRIAPVGRIEIKDTSDPTSMKTGEQVYQVQCAACHGTGAAGAPKLADAAAWGPRLKAGYDGLMTSAMKGKGSMGPQGGGDFSDTEIGRAVVYMANQAGAKMAEPKMPAAAASAASK
ncbi:MAG: c-type cytochrome [Aquabacterium sp.]